ncbi:hypothetical protein Angca_001517, partial [Angiostrongylus cantonensis]
QFRRKCKAFFLDKDSEFLHGRLSEVHGLVLRNGELEPVVNFVHQSLGHCSVEVW